MLTFVLIVHIRFDNPASGASFPSRQLTYNYLLPLNTFLLLFPLHLCCDWTMGTVPLVTSLLDPRNLATVTFYVVLMVFCWKALTVRAGVTKHVLVIGLSFIAFPFIPASNIFFPVGFVIAERVLYIPSMGFCMILGYGWYQMSSTSQLYFKSVTGSSSVWLKHFASALLVLTIVGHCARTISRNSDWRSEFSVFTAGLRVTQTNAKLYNNVGHALEEQRKYLEALDYFQTAVRAQPDDIGAHMNVGRTYGHLGMLDLSESAYLRAKNLLPKPRPGVGYHARIAPSHLNVFLNLANLISKDSNRLEEADALYRQAISMRSDYTQAYINRGDILMKLNRTLEAKQVYEKALQFDHLNPDLHYNVSTL